MSLIQDLEVAYLPVPGAILKVSARLTEDQKRRIKAWWATEYASNPNRMVRRDECPALEVVRLKVPA